MGKNMPVHSHNSNPNVSMVELSVIKTQSALPRKGTVPSGRLANNSVLMLGTRASTTMRQLPYVNHR